MRVLTEEQLGLLAFVDACNGSGYRPTHDELLAWVESPLPRPGRNKVQDIIASAVFANPLFFTIEGTQEDLVKHAIRLRWIEGDRLVLTLLGQALLQSAERQHVSEAEVTVVALDRDDPLAYPRLVGRLAALGSALLVDPYLRLEQFDEILRLTDVDRVVISKQYKESKQVRAALSVYLSSTQLPRPIDVRASTDPDVHDRMIVSPDAVHVLGQSLNGVAAGTSSTFLIKLPDAAAAAQRDRAETWWTEAEPVGPQPADSTELDTGE